MIMHKERLAPVKLVLKGNPALLNLKTKCFYTILAVLIVQALGCIPSPFIDPVYAKMVLGVDPALGFFNAMTGQGFSRLSMMTLSITPYITASIVLQLLAIVIKPLSDLLTDTSDSAKKKKWAVNIALSAFLAFTQGIAMAIGYGRQGIITTYTWYSILIITAFWTLGTAAAAGMGWFISTRLIGRGTLNGVSIILLANILSSYAADAAQVYEAASFGRTAVSMAVRLAVVIVLVVAMFLLVTIGQLSEKRLRVQQSKRASDTFNFAGTDFRIKLWPGSVVPVIFASQIYAIPAIIRSVTGAAWTWPNYFNSGAWFNPQTPIYTLGAIPYIALIILFSYYYSEMSVNVKEVAENFKRHGYTLPGIRPGKPTEDFINKQMKYVIFIGGAALSVIAIVPCIVSGTMGISGLAFLGTSLLITVGVILEIRDYIASQTRFSTRKLGGFLRA